MSEETQEPFESLRDPGEAMVVPDGMEELEDGSSLLYPVTAIGASAGGVEAYLQLFGALPPDTGMAFVVISHLMAEAKSHLVEILSRATSMSVDEIREGTQPEPNHVYVLPAGVQARIERGVFRLEPRQSDVANRPIDYFFRSLATDQKTRAIGVVLSGTDSDGALGLKAIKGEGGMALVQAPDTAQFPDMPRSSIYADHVDRILAPEQISSELAVIARQFRDPAIATLAAGGPTPGGGQDLNRILGQLRSVSGIDFRLYKPSTIRRRIARRMMLQRVRSFKEYSTLLQSNPRELRNLQEDALINVTRFFRDPGVYEALKLSILPRLFEDRPSDQQVRIWVAGCSTGEEVYSIAICLLEYLTGRTIEPSIQIFGTDASDFNIHKARLGIFPESIASEVSPERLRRFFIKVEKGYQLSKRVRDLCIFARQNLCNDPPFSKMDLISCRNVLIYLGSELQKQILPTFHYALRPNGYLLLGITETIREFTEIFQLIDRRHKFFAKVGVSPARTMSVFPPHFDTAPPPTTVATMRLQDTWGDVELQRAADRIVLSRYAPPGVVVDERLEILQSRGHTSPYLEMPQGAATLQLNRMLRDSIAGPVNQAVRNSIDQDIPIRVEGLIVRDGEEQKQITLEVLPIHTVAPRSRCFLVLFAPAAEKSRGEVENEPRAGSPEHSQVVETLRQELAANKLYLQTLLEERDARNQELVSANEEIQSSNEELQSTNEELETTKEELQSSNEELQTVNEELQQRNAILTQTSNDLQNLLKSVNLPVLMLSNELHIRHFTPPTQRLMNLRPADLGRPFGEIRLNLSVDDLQPLFHEVLETLAPRELEVQDREGRWFLLRVRPYRTTENKIDGIVVVLLDIDQRRKSEHELRAARDFSRSVIENMPLPLAVVDLELRIRAANDAFRSLVGPAHDPLERRSLLDLTTHAWGLNEPLRSHLDKLRSGAEKADFQFEYNVPGENLRVLNVRARELQPESEVFLLITFEDVTAQVRIARLLTEDRERLARQVESAAKELGRTQDDLRGLAGSLIDSQEEERRRVARELHDGICQKLAALEIDTQRVSRQLGENAGQNVSELERVRSGIAALADEVRRISHGLHPSAIDDLGLLPALKALVLEFQEREGMIASVSAQNIPADLPLDIATGLYRIAQEALHNVSKHAGKTHVKVILRGGENALYLQVVDSGEGFDTEAQHSGLGLISMQERARMMGGTFQIESDLGAGTKVTVQAPLPD